MRLTIEMHQPSKVIMEEIARGDSQKSVALTYAFIIAQMGDCADWQRINTAISERWPSKSGLTRVKKMAWKQLEEWQCGIPERQP